MLRIDDYICVATPFQNLGYFRARVAPVISHATVVMRYARNDVHRIE